MQARTVSARPDWSLLIVVKLCFHAAPAETTTTTYVRVALEIVVVAGGLEVVVGSVREPRLHGQGQDGDQQQPRDQAARRRSTPSSTEPSAPPLYLSRPLSSWLVTDAAAHGYNWCAARRICSFERGIMNGQKQRWGLAALGHSSYRPGRQSAPSVTRMLAACLPRSTGGASNSNSKTADTARQGRCKGKFGPFPVNRFAIVSSSTKFQYIIISDKIRSSWEVSREDERSRC